MTETNEIMGNRWDDSTWGDDNIWMKSTAIDSPLHFVAFNEVVIAV